MKVIKLIDGKEYLTEDSEADHVKKIIMAGKFKFLPLTNGELVNITSISRIGDLDKIPHYDKYPLDKTGLSFRRDGRMIFLGPDDFACITQEIDPKYLSMSPVKLLEK